MQRHRSTNQPREDNKGRAANKNKENPLSDTVYLIQNENQVLRMKNTQLNVKIKQLKLQLQVYTDNIALRERELENIKSNINVTSYKEDIEIENQKKLLTEKLTFLRSNEEILLRKIKEAREATIFQEQKIANVQHDRKGIQLQILSMKAQNEGTKIILHNLEDENERLRSQNQTLISKRKINEPKEKEITIQIQERIRIIKNQQQTLKNLKRYQTSKLIDSILTIIYNKKLKEHFAKIENYGLIKKIAKKKIIQLALIRKKYTLFIKNKIIQQLRKSFNPLVQQEAAKRIIAATHRRRVKALIWRKWRTAAKNAEFMTMRRFQFQNLLQKLAQSFSKTNLFAAFNMIKYFRNNPIRQRAAIIIESTYSAFMKRYKSHFFSSLRSAQKSYEINCQIDISSKQQSQMLVTSLYFTAWAKIAKSRGIENKNIKRRYFKQLKKLLALKKRRVLGQMLINTNLKINNIDTESKVFTEMKKESMIGKLESLNEEKQLLKEKTIALEEELSEMRTEKKCIYQQLALLKVSKYLKTKVQKAFDIWRLRKQQSKVLLTIVNLIESKKSFDKNFAFSKILKKRFAMLKKSIRDKIQSCEFSYNYLLDENKHIKQVLDNKQHELQKSKFMNILKKIMRNEKEVKLKYFYKFMKNGYKFWKFRKTCAKIDKMMTKKVKIVFMWILKSDMRAIKQERRIESFIEGKEAIIMEKAKKFAFKGFLLNRQRNKQLKRILGGIFERNLQLDFYVAFGKVRNQQHIHNRSLIQADIDETLGEINNRNTASLQQENQISILKNRLKDKEEILCERKILGLFRFFVKNIKIKFGGYINRWRERVVRENRVKQFAQILERKTRIMLKNKFMLSINKKNQDFTLQQLQEKQKKYQNQYDNMAQNQQIFLKQKQAESAKMKNQNQFFRKQGQVFEKKTDFMTNIKLKSFLKEWGKKFTKYIFREWRNQTDIFINTWTNVDKRLSNRVLKETYIYIMKDMKEEAVKYKHRKNLDRIYTKKWRYNAGLGFKIWRIVFLDKRIKVWTEEEKMQMKRYEGLEKTYKYAISRHNGQVDYRQHDVTIRGLWNAWRQYAQKKIFNNIKKDKLDGWLLKGYSSEFFKLLKRIVSHKIQFKQRYNAFIKKWQILRIKAFMDYTSKNKHRRNSIIKLFIHKFCPFMIHKTHQEFMSRIKNYNNRKEVDAKSDKTNRIQHVIEVFQKKRKGILNFYLRKWLRNQYEMRIAKNLMKRITKNAMNWRVRDLFFSWKLEAEAKKVKQMHQQEGEVKKRKIQINRLKIFLQNFKKQKGLLLEDDAGKLVLSPRFQQKKDQQIKKDNNMRYKFISRLILSMNGYAAPVKVYNNLKMYTLIREKYKKFAKFARNNLRKPDIYYAFRIWHKASTDFNKMFDTMERKDLIKILNKQKDKMEMQYSKKISLQEKIQEQMRAHKILAYQEEKKQKICAHILLKNLRKIKLYTMLTWKQRVSEMKQAELEHLQQQGNAKINNLEEQVNDLQLQERQLREKNQQLQQAVREAVEIAQMVKRITEERDLLSNLILEKLMTCQSLQEENQQLNAKLYQAQKEAMNLLILSGERL